MMTSKAQLAREKLLRRAAIAGAVAGLLCQMLPHEHRGLCTAALKLLTITTCGG